MLVPIQGLLSFHRLTNTVQPFVFCQVLYSISPQNSQQKQRTKNFHMFLIHFPLLTLIDRAIDRWIKKISDWSDRWLGWLAVWALALLLPRIATLNSSMWHTKQTCCFLPSMVSRWGSPPPFTGILPQCAPLHPPKNSHAAWHSGHLTGLPFPEHPVKLSESLGGQGSLLVSLREI